MKIKTLKYTLQHIPTVIQHYDIILYFLAHFLVKEKNFKNVLILFITILYEQAFHLCEM